MDLHNPSGESACTSDVTCSGKFKDLSSGAPVDTTSWTDMDFAEVSKASPSKLCLRLKRSSVLGVVGVDCDASLEYPICQYECGGERKMTTASHNTWQSTSCPMSSVAEAAISSHIICIISVVADASATVL